MAQSKNSVVSNLIWRFAERSGAQLIQFAVSIVLARMLAPEAYGTIALVLVFAQIFQVFVDSGLGNALIQKKDADDLDFSSVFYFNVVWCLFLYMILYFCAPLIASFYEDPSLVWIVRVLCLTVVISGLKNVQQAYVSRTMQFRKFFFSTLGGTIMSAVVGIFIALEGGGVWALVAQKIVNISVDTLVLWFTVQWRPKLMFSFQRLKYLFSYGWKLLASALLDVTYNNLRQLIIGKMYSESSLAFYNQGRQFPDLIVTNINSSIDSVLFPTLSKEQDDKEKVKVMTRRSIKVSTYIMAPMMMGLIFTASNVIVFILTEKWLPSVPFLILFCISYMFYPIHTANLNAIKALGRSDLFLRMEILKKIVGMILLLATMNYGVLAMACSMPVSTMCSMVINSYPNKELLEYSYFDQIKDIAPSILLALGMGICVYFIPFLIHGSTVFVLMIQIMAGILLYIGGSILFKNDSFYYLLSIVKQFKIK